MSSEAPPKGPSKLTREELYNLVWQTPMQHVAAQYGITGNGVAKICDRLNVPYPYRGYWAKKAAKKPVKQLPLPATKFSTPTDVTIAPTPPGRPSSTSSMPSELKDSYDEAKSRAASIRVSTSLRNPHPVIAGWIADNAREIADAKRFGKSFTPPRFTELDRRRHLILDTLFKELQKRDVKIKSEQYRGTWLEIAKERVDFTLTERIRQIRRRLTNEERLESWYRNQEWRQERIPTGLLTFKITTPLGAGIPVQWTDDTDVLLEDRIAEIVAVLDLAGPILRERRRIADEVARKRHEEERRRYEEHTRRKQERNRWRRFLELSAQWKSATIAREFLTVLEGLSPSTEEIGGRTHTEWLEWARVEMNKYDPANNDSGAIWESLASVSS